MRIKKVTYRDRNDFLAVYKCEYCGAETNEQWGYDDDYFVKVVIPGMKCEKCGKKSVEGENNG